MIVALASLAVLAVAIVSMAGLMRSQVRQQARERGLLIDQIMHLSNHTWGPPPVDNGKTDEPRAPLRFDRSPEQDPGV